MLEIPIFSKALQRRPSFLMTVMAASSTNILSSAPEVGSWAEAVEQDNLQNNDVNEDGVKTVVAYIEEDGARYKVVTQFKVITKNVPRVVAERKKLKKFGLCRDEPPGPQVSTTYVAEEVEMQFTRNRAGEQILDVQEDKQTAKATSREHCRHCKGNDHWSTNCPYKEMYQMEEDVDPAEAAEKERAAAGTGRYVAPGMRGDARQGDRRSDENTCRVTNLPQEMEEAELRELFAAIGRVSRVFIARDKVTNQPKGFAFVTYDLREDAERAIAKLNGIRKHHMVLKVEWTRCAFFKVNKIYVDVMKIIFTFAVPLLRRSDSASVLFEMGLLTILRKQREREREIRVLILGLDNAGKTTITKKFLGEDLSTVEPTLGIAISDTSFNIKTVDFHGFTINFWDVGGQKSLRSYWRNYFEQTDALIWVVDSGDQG
ncbi:ADP-ribosylation factor family protein [Ancylostoma duodenale]|uniref:Eukaryotic translation initiation factor 3 subunit G n=1 Tax=Ancylostoma duodenale TaxID=51022 RepID=A0A0C2D090_9BILA|nr:ADP-ribosylation factor family protein [Ancylostoma duodenale]